MRKIGFDPKRGELIQDPLQLRFRVLTSKQPANTTRYSCKVGAGKKSRTFDLYVPNLLLKAKVPKRLLMVLSSLD